MFFRSLRKRHSKHAASDSAEGQAGQLHDWRRSAQKVRRTWKCWLAAEGRERDALYGDYMAALAAEELAAARVEIMVRRREPSRH